MSLDVTLRPARLCPSTLLEAYTLATGKPGKGAKSQGLFNNKAVEPANAALTQCAASWLVRVADRIEPQLSRDSAIDRATDRAMTALDGFLSRRLAALERSRRPCRVHQNRQKQPGHLHRQQRVEAHEPPENADRRPPQSQKQIRTNRKA